MLSGPEGSEKTLLLKALAGIRRASGGQVLIDGVSLYDHPKSFRTRIGFVPKGGITHPDLTVYEALMVAARLRMPRGTGVKVRRHRVEAMIAGLDLTAQRGFRIKDLHLEQRKRVDLAVELIANQGLIFLEEPMVSLDPGAEARLARLLRNLADQGWIVISSGDQAGLLSLADKVAFLTPGGTLAWYGPLREALAYFIGYQSLEDHKTLGVNQVFELLDNPAKGSPQEWADRFQVSPAFRQYTGDASKSKKPELALDERPLARQQKSAEAPLPPPIPRQASGLAQFFILSARNLKLLGRDPIALLVMLALPLLLVWVDLIFSNRQMYDPTGGDAARIQLASSLLVFFVMLAAGITWMREITKEAEIYQRERQVVLGILPYLLSKIWLVALLALFVAVVWTIFHFVVVIIPGGLLTAFKFLITLALAAFAGGMLGLLSSALSPSKEAAPLLLAAFLLPQLLFSGALLPLSKLNLIGAAVTTVMPSRFAFEALSTADGHGKDLTNDACWKYSEEIRKTLTDSQKQSCACLGANIFSKCGFPGIRSLYTPAIDQPEPVKPPQPPEGQSSSETLESLLQYSSDFARWQNNRDAAIDRAEGRLEDEFYRFGPTFNVSLPGRWLALSAEIVLFLFLLIWIQKRKDFK